ncbi:Protein of unknown function [Gryllus bimaculatus]|nr:Protein of unknown function [Gryllus bimaculatus]
MDSLTDRRVDGQRTDRWKRRIDGRTDRQEDGRTVGQTHGDK